MSVYIAMERKNQKYIPYIIYCQIFYFLFSYEVSRVTALNYILATGITLLFSKYYKGEESYHKEYFMTAGEYLPVDLVHYNSDTLAYSGVDLVSHNFCVLRGSVLYKIILNLCF